MNNCTELMSSIKVALTRSGIKSTNDFENIQLDDLLPRLKRCEIGQKDGEHFLRSPLKMDELGRCLSRSDDHAESMANVIIIDADNHIDENGELYSEERTDLKDSKKYYLKDNIYDFYNNASLTIYQCEKSKDL